MPVVAAQVSLLLLFPLLLAIHSAAAFTCASKVIIPSHNSRRRQLVPLRRPISIVTMTSLPSAVAASIQKIDDLITTDAGGRGMKHLVVPGDLRASAEILARLKRKGGRRSAGSEPTKPRVVILTGFPCCVDHSPPTETDGLASVAIARAAVSMGYDAALVTEECNGPVFAAGAADGSEEECRAGGSIDIVLYPSGGSSSSWSARNDDDLKRTAEDADLVIACERAGPAADGYCYTMRGINMNERGLIAPLHDVVAHARKENKKFIAIGDGGNELGMGKVIHKIHEHIPDGKKIGAVTAADHLIAASVSNWGAYALIAAAALVFALDKVDPDNEGGGHDREAERKSIVDDIMPTEESETRLLHRCVAAGCRDGVSGKMEATVDGMPLERSMQCLRDIRSVALSEPQTQ